MGEGKSTSSVRVERWQALLSATDAQDAGREQLRGSGSVNLLSGVWLHAAARAQQGMQLTELERSVLAPLQKVLGEEEMRAVGRVYVEQLAEGGPSRVLPRVVTSRSLQEGFTLEEFRAAEVEMLPQITALPNVAVVDRAKLAAGDSVDSPEFVAALNKSGYGITAFTGEGDQDSGIQTSESYRARLEWDHFLCVEAAGDQGGGRDEIYFTAASNATNFSYSTRTKETGSVEDNKIYAIHGDHVTGNKGFFDKQLDGCMSSVVSIWEADQSNSEWYDALGDALARVVATMEGPDRFIGLIPGLDLFGHMNTALSFISTFWEALRNKDDQVLSRGFALGLADMAALHYNAPSRMAVWDFNARDRGMGHFKVLTRYAGSPPPIDGGDGGIEPWEPAP